MTPTERQLQRDLDGRLSHIESTGLHGILADHPLRRSDAALRQVLRRRDGASQPAVQCRQRILDQLPAGVPVRSWRILPRDVLLTVAVMACLAVVCGLVSTTPSTLLGSATFLVWVIGLCLAAGSLLVLLPGRLRSIEASLLQRLLHRPLLIARSETLVYRAVGVALIATAWWLGR